MLRIFLALMAVFLPLGSISAAQNDEDGILFEIGGFFFTPSHNIYCNYYSAGGNPGEQDHDKASEIHCTRLQPSPVMAKLTGTGKLTITTPKKAEIAYGEKDQILGYGETRKLDYIDCTSAETGITCTVNGKGFSMAKSGVRVVK